MNNVWPMVELGEIAEYINGYAFKPTDWEETGKPIIRIQNLTNSSDVLNKTTKEIPEKYHVSKGDLLISWSATIGFYIWDNEDAYLNQHIFKVIPSEKITKMYLYCLGSAITEAIKEKVHGNTMTHITKGTFDSIKIPLPPLSVQQEIVAEIENYQRIIDGARQIVNNYKPTLKIDPSWEVVKLKDICKSITDGDHMPPPKSDKGVPFVTISNITFDREIDFTNTFFVSKEYYDQIKENRKPITGDILYTVTGSFGIPVYVDYEKEFCFQRHIGLIRANERVLSKFLYYYLMTPIAFKQAEESATGMAQKTVSLTCIRDFNIFLPSLEIQQEIVEQISEEMAIVEQNKRLIEIFQQKIKSKMSEVWGE